MQSDCICIVYLCVPVCERAEVQADPGLKAHGFKVLTVKKDNSALNLNPFVCLSLRHYKLVHVDEVLAALPTSLRFLKVRRCRLNTSG